MKNKVKSVKHWLGFKEVRIAAIVAIFNMELVVIPLILKGLLDLEGVTLKVIAGSWATMELSFWYWFSGWVLEKTRETKPVKDAISIGKSVNKEEFSEVRDTTLVQRLDEWAYEHIVGRFDPKNNPHKRSFMFLKGLGYVFGLPAIFAVSVFPLIWIVPFTVCRWTDWKTGILVVFIANFLRNAGFAEIWDYVWVLF